MKKLSTNQVFSLILVISYAIMAIAKIWFLPSLSYFIPFSLLIFWLLSNIIDNKRRVSERIVSSCSFFAIVASLLLCNKLSGWNFNAYDLIISILIGILMVFILVIYNKYHRKLDL